MKRIVALCLAAACLISMVGCAGDTNMDEKKPNNSASAYALALASYPEMAPYPNEMEYFDEKTGEFLYVVRSNNHIRVEIAGRLDHGRDAIYGKWKDSLGYSGMFHMRK